MQEAFVPIRSVKREGELCGGSFCPILAAVWAMIGRSVPVVPTVDVIPARVVIVTASQRNNRPRIKQQ